MGITRWELHGLKLTEDENFLSVLKVAHSGGFAVQSNFARCAAVDVAMAASLGCISTCTGVDNKGYGRVWYVTHKGLGILKVAKEQEQEACVLKTGEYWFPYPTPISAIGSLTIVHPRTPASKGHK